MKRFEFRLQKVLEWRGLQERLALADLEKLHAELAALAAQTDQLLRSRDEAGRELTTREVATGVELAFLDTFRQASSAELARIDRQRADCRRRIAAQMEVTLERRRAVRILQR